MSQTSWQVILHLADRLDPQMRADVLDALTRVQNDISVDEVARAIARGSTATANMIAGQHALSDDLAAAVETMQKAFLAAGSAGAMELVRAAGFRPTFRFDVTNPFATQYAKELSAQLVTRVSNETRQAIRSLVTQAYEQQIPARDIARSIKPLIGLTERQALAAFNYRQELLQSGLPVDRAGAQADRYAGKLLKERAAMIARTELMSASNFGQLALWEQARAAGLLAPGTVRKWVVTPDDHLCPRCEAMQGQVAVLGRPFVTPSGVVLMAPPLHPRCRCVAVLIIRGQ
jgi:hypothetical protein